jgi:hypothetical protein
MAKKQATGQIDKAKLLAWLDGEAVNLKRTNDRPHFAVAEKQTKYIRNVIKSGIFDISN